jgi:hypothetical protein
MIYYDYCVAQCWYMLSLFPDLGWDGTTNVFVLRQTRQSLTEARYEVVMYRAREVRVGSTSSDGLDVRRFLERSSVERLAGC